jgi:hypothetical protein
MRARIGLPAVHDPADYAPVGSPIQRAHSDEPILDGVVKDRFGGLGKTVILSRVVFAHIGWSIDQLHAVAMRALQIGERLTQAKHHFTRVVYGILHVILADFTPHCVVCRCHIHAHAFVLCLVGGHRLCCDLTVCVTSSKVEISKKRL